MNRRVARVRELLRAELSELIRREVKDPRISEMVTIVSVDLSPDLRQAHVFVSVLGTADEQAETLRGLRAAHGFLRTRLGERLTLRRIPQLDFQLDRSIEQGARILKILTGIGERADESPGEGGPETTRPAPG